MLNFAIQENQISVPGCCQLQILFSVLLNSTLLYLHAVFSFKFLLYAEIVVKVKIELKLKPAFHDNLYILQKVAKF